MHDVVVVVGFVRVVQGIRVFYQIPEETYHVYLKIYNITIKTFEFEKCVKHFLLVLNCLKSFKLISRILGIEPREVTFLKEDEQVQD